MRMRLAPHRLGYTISRGRCAMSSRKVKTADLFLAGFQPPATVPHAVNGCGKPKLGTNQWNIPVYACLKAA